MALALEHLSRHELHHTRPVTSSTRHSPFPVNQSRFRVSLCNDIALENVPVRNLPILKQRLVTDVILQAVPFSLAF
jgi:hypothetical protein